MSSIDRELRDLRSLLDRVLSDLSVLECGIEEAEAHILNDNKTSFWEPKLSQLRVDKQHLIRTEEQLRDQILVRERHKFTSMRPSADPSVSRASPPPSTSIPIRQRGAAMQGMVGRYSSESSGYALKKESRARSGSWAADHESAVLSVGPAGESKDIISRDKYLQTVSRLHDEQRSKCVSIPEGKGTDEEDKLQPSKRPPVRVRSCPAVMTMIESHTGGREAPLVASDFKPYSGQFNVFGIDPSTGEELDSSPGGNEDSGQRQCSDPPQTKEQLMQCSTTGSADGMLTMAGILGAIKSRAIDSFRYAESLIITQEYNSDDGGDDSSGPPYAALDSFRFAESLILTQGEDDRSELPAPDEIVRAPSPLLVESHRSPHSHPVLAMAPTVSAHDFSVFGVDLADDNDDGDLNDI